MNFVFYVYEVGGVVCFLQALYYMAHLDEMRR